MKEQELEVKCRELPWSKSSDYNDLSFSETFKFLNPLFKQYGMGTVFGTLSGIWKTERAISFWEKYTFEPPVLLDRTLSIATFYTRAYNGGIERVQAELIKIWVDMGFRVILITEEKNPLDYPYPSNVKRFIIPPSSEMTQRLKAIERIILEEKISVYVNHLWYDASIIWESALMRINRIPFITYQHSTFTFLYGTGQEFSYLSHRAFRLCSMIVSLSESAARFHQMCGCNSFYVLNPVPEGMMQVKENTRRASKKILWIGRLSEEKKTKDAILMMKEVLKKVPDAMLEIVGQFENDYGEETRRLCSELGLDANVTFHGYQKNVSAFYENCDVLVITSETEGFSLVLLEGNAYGIPCVMYQLPFLFNTTSENGIVTVPQGRIDLMSDAVSDLLTDDKKRWEYGKKARKRFEAVQAYDIQNAWQRIFSLCFGIDGQYEDFYNPEELEEYEKDIIPAVFAEQYRALDAIRKDSPDYKFGHHLLIFPRYILHAIRKMTGKYGKV